MDNISIEVFVYFYLILWGNRFWGQMVYTFELYITLTQLPSEETKRLLFFNDIEDIKNMEVGPER